MGNSTIETFKTVMIIFLLLLSIGLIALILFMNQRNACFDVSLTRNEALTEKQPPTDYLQSRNKLYKLKIEESKLKMINTSTSAVVWFIEIPEASEKFGVSEYGHLYTVDMLGNKLISITFIDNTTPTKTYVYITPQGVLTGVNRINNLTMWTKSK